MKLTTFESKNIRQHTVMLHLMLQVKLASVYWLLLENSLTITNSSKIFYQ